MDGVVVVVGGGVCVCGGGELRQSDSQISGFWERWGGKGKCQWQQIRENDARIQTAS